MNKCLSTFYVSVRRKDGSFYKKTSLLSLRTALDRHLKSPPHNKNYLTNHSLRATTVTVLSANNIETRKIKAITGHKSDTSVESYCQRPTLDQFKQMSSALTSFTSGKESPETYFSVPSTSTTTVLAMRSSSDERLPLGRHEENFLLSTGLKFP